MSKVCGYCKGKGCKRCKRTGYEIEKLLKLRVWHIPQVPAREDADIFRVDVKTVDEAVLILNTLWSYDNFQFERKIKPDFSNASGLEYWDREPVRSWQEYYDEFGNDICTIIREKEESKK